uniref:Uncharacterized protein MANES_16G128700 n=1 Tax=Rhizophora mucronata TaxID=61149 RepID=A0A2P2MAH8_RHIMU
MIVTLLTYQRIYQNCESSMLHVSDVQFDSCRHDLLYTIMGNLFHLFFMVVVSKIFVSCEFLREKNSQILYNFS